MVVTSTEELQAGAVSSYDRLTEFKAFDDSKTGIQGLIENGMTKVPRMFHCGQSDLNDGLTSESSSKFSIPIIDLTGINGDSIQRDDVVGKVRHACEKWGIFQIVNHGIPTEILDEMIEGTCRFHQQDAKVRKEYYTRDRTKKVIYNCNFNLFHQTFANWRDTLTCSMAPHPPKAEELPAVCRDIVMEYSKNVMVLASTLFDLLSEALGLNRFHLNEMGCADGFFHLCHYYPACPEPDLTIGSGNHTDSSFITILLQDQMSGLQFLHENQWVDVPPIRGALAVNIGDLMQFITNDKFYSVQHRVLAKHIGPRISIASLFRADDKPGQGTSKVFGPIKELLSEESPPVYRDASLKEFSKQYFAQGIGTSALSHFKL